MKPGLEGAAVPEGLAPDVFSFFERRPAALCRECWLGLEPARGTSPLFAGRGMTPMLVTPFYTNAILISLIRFLKFEGGVTAARPLAWWMACAILRCGGPIDDEALLVPVPLHRRRRRRRGYNQSALLAAAIARSVGLRCDTRALVRHRPTVSQTRLDDGKRDSNVRGAFRVADRSGVSGGHIILVDDLVTSGSTVRSCVESMREAEPARVTILAAGRRKHQSYIEIKPGTSVPARRSKPGRAAAARIGRPTGSP